MIRIEIVALRNRQDQVDALSCISEFPDDRFESVVRLLSSDRIAEGRVCPPACADNYRVGIRVIGKRDSFLDKAVVPDLIIFPPVSAQLRC